MTNSVIVRASSAFIKHAVAGLVVVVACVGITVAAYFALLLWAIVTNGGLGGPLALPGMIVLALAASVAVILIVLLPVTTMTRIVCGRVERHRWLSEIAVSSIVVVLAVVAVALAIGMSRHADPLHSLAAGALGAAALLVLLGLYWWSYHATALLLRVGTSLWSRCRDQLRRRR